MDEIIKVNDVSMRFNLAQEKTETLKEYTVKLLTHKLFFNEFYALKHVSFSMKRGESLALIGRNGSGKKHHAESDFRRDVPLRRQRCRQRRNCPHDRAGRRF